MRRETAAPLPTAAWVTHADARFLPLARVLAEGLAAFSRHPVVLYAVTADPEPQPDPDLAAPNLIVRRIAGAGRHIAYLKLAALLDALDAGVERGVYLDADHVPTPAVDRLFELSRKIGETPLLPRHPRDLGDEVNGALMAELGVAAKSMPYAHSCAIGFAPSCRRFLAECDALARDCEQRGAHPPVVDETIMNVLLWKWGATRQLPSVNLPHRLFESWLAGRLTDDPAWRKRYAGHPWEALTFHYAKDPARARAMLAAMRRPAPRKAPLQ
jgi:hypothetical protein